MTGAVWAGIAVTIAVGVVGVLIPLMLRLGAIQRENRDAHEQIGKNIRAAESGLRQDLSGLRHDIDERGKRRIRAMIDAEL